MHKHVIRNVYIYICIDSIAKGFFYQCALGLKRERLRTTSRSQIAVMAKRHPVTINKGGCRRWVTLGRVLLAPSFVREERRTRRSPLLRVQERWRFFFLPFFILSSATKSYARSYGIRKRKKQHKKRKIISFLSHLNRIPRVSRCF